MSRLPEEGVLVIAGAGIGGLALATGLSRRGIPAAVFERRPDLAATGAGISLWPNALAALDRLGLGDEVRAVGGTVASGGIRRPEGAWIQRYDQVTLATALDEPMVVVHRGDLLRILADAVGASSLHTGVAVEGFGLGPGGVAVRLSDGSTRNTTGLVGADGVHSAVASGLWPRERLRYAGYTAWRGISTYVIGAGDTPSATWGAGGEFGFVPLGTDRTYWFATENTGEGGLAPGGELPYLRNKFSNWHPPIAEILAATDPADVLRNDIYDRSQAPGSVHGPVTVVGDAAHPMRPHLGQGGCQALEDAVVLSECLASTADPAQAFRLYESARRRRVRRIVRESAMLGRFIQAPPPLGPYLHHLARITPKRLLLRRIADIGGGKAMRR